MDYRYGCDPNGYGGSAGAGGPLLMTPQAAPSFHHLHHDGMSSAGGMAMMDDNNGWAGAMGIGMHASHVNGMLPQPAGRNMYWQQQSDRDGYSTDDAPMVSQPLQSRSDGRVVCKYFASGGCDRGESCPFSHDLTVSATNATEATCGFVLTGQVVNLKHPQRSGSGGKSDDDTRVASPVSATAAAPSMQQHLHHPMNPTAVPFVSSSGVDMDMMAYAAGVGGAGRLMMGGNMSSSMHSYMTPHDAASLSMGGVYGGGGDEPQAMDEEAMYAAYQHQTQMMMSSHHGHTSATAFGSSMPMEGGGMYHHPHHDSGMMTDRGGDNWGDPSGVPYYSPNGGYGGSSDGYGVDNGGDFAGSSSGGWRPAGVFNAPDGLRGYEEYQTSLVMAGRNREALYHHRRMQAMRPPIGSVPPVVSLPGTPSNGGVSASSAATANGGAGQSTGMSFTPYAAANTSATTRTTINAAPHVAKPSSSSSSSNPNTTFDSKVQLTPYAPATTVATGRQPNGAAATWTTADVHRSLRNR